jgi:uncharacterized protein YdhG (YjbR/CyaY superfamily)
VHPEVEAYLAAAPPAERPVLEDLRALILHYFPSAEEGFDSRFPVYKTSAGEWIAGFATRKRGVMFYLLDHEVLDAFGNELGKLRTGHGCIAYKATKQRSLASLRELVIDMLAASAKRRNASG